MPEHDLASFLGQTALFAPLSSAHREMVSRRLVARQLTAGEELLREGAPGRSMYLVAEGTLEVLDAGGAAAERQTRIARFGVVGEMGVLTGERRNATVRAVDDALVLRLGADDLDALAATDAALQSALAKVLLRGLEQAQIRRALHRGELFGATSGDARRSLERYLEPRRLQRGEVLFESGSVSDCAFVVVSGRLRVQTAAGERVAELGHGEIVGEMGLLTDQVRGTTVCAARDTLVAVLRRDDFWAFVETSPRTVLSRITGTIVSRLQQETADRGSRRSPTSFVLMPLRPDRASGQWADALVKAMARFGSVLHVNRARLDALLGVEGAADTAVDAPYHARLSRWLTEQELAYDIVLYEAGPTFDVWTRRCLRQADHLLFFARAEQSPDRSTLERAINDHEMFADVRRSLVLVHQPDTRLPSGTRHWLAQRPVDAHYHIREGREEDIARVARSLTGRAVGLVLSGGGARGLAHVGGIDALRSMGIPIDMVCGTSMGAVVAAECAMGWPLETSQEYHRREFARGLDYTVPIMSLLVGRNWQQVMMSFFGETEIEDLWLPYFCVSANLSRARCDVLDRGPVVRAVRASSAVPGLLPPVAIDGDVHVDGGLFNNLPVDLLAQRAPGATVLAMMMADFPALPASPQLDALPSGWRLLGQMLRPGRGGPEVPGIADILLRSTMLTNTQVVKRSIEQAHLAWTLPADDYGLVDFNAEAIEALPTMAREATLRQFEQWRQEGHPVVDRLMGQPD